MGDLGWGDLGWETLDGGPWMGDLGWETLDGGPWMGDLGWETFDGRPWMGEPWMHHLHELIGVFWEGSSAMHLFKSMILAVIYSWVACHTSVDLPPPWIVPPPWICHLRGSAWY